MHDPNRIVLNTKRVMVIRTETTDRVGVSAPWREVLDPRRYGVSLWPGTSKRLKLYAGRLYRPVVR